MIIDTLNNIDFYFGMSKELDLALSIMKHYRFSMLQAGEYTDITEGDAVVKIMEPDLVCDENAVPWEYHTHTIDVQYVLKGGSERIGYAPQCKLDGWGEYDAQKDVTYSRAECSYLPVQLEEEDFAIFFPQDAHRKVSSTGREGYRKIVIKVPARGFHLVSNR